jgi:hypothetical protein
VEIYQSIEHVIRISEENIMVNESYQHELWTGSGSTNVSLQLQEGGDVECKLRTRWMGEDECHYYLTGRYEPLSQTYGRIFIQHVNVQQIDRSSPENTQIEELDLRQLEVDLIYEYIKLDRSPAFYHPDEDLSLMSSLGYAGWNPFFELILITDPFVTQTVDTFKDIDDAPEERLQKHFRNLVYLLDKLKFAKNPASSPSS